MTIFADHLFHDGSKEQKPLEQLVPGIAVAKAEVVVFHQCENQCQGQLFVALRQVTTTWDTVLRTVLAAVPATVLRTVPMPTVVTPSFLTKSITAWLFSPLPTNPKGIERAHAACDDTNRYDIRRHIACNMRRSSRARARAHACMYACCMYACTHVEGHLWVLVVCAHLVFRFLLLREHLEEVDEREAILEVFGHRGVWQIEVSSLRATCSAVC